ncbi:HD domain-containing protein [Actinomyces minihominis]|uniref:HD domain-containing protein n=1 Tax=Actinomyces minihominis TaxID=2002838 RepID=UPI00101ADE8F|nr:hypothetical protein [Actinomyces minihominis]
MVSSTPPWLHVTLDDALVSAGATAPEEDRRAFIDRIIEAWNYKGRSFHNSRYLAYVFERLDELEGAMSDPELLRLAAALRGAIEEPGWEESESQRTPAVIPALVNIGDLLRLGIPSSTVERIGSLTEQLASHSPSPEDLDAKILVDADLAALAAPPQQYREFLSHFREEAPHLSEVDFLKARQKVLKLLCGQRRIFATPLASQWEDAARENLEAELDTTKRKLKSLRSSADTDADEEPVAKESPEGPRERGTSRVLRISRAHKSEQIRSMAEPNQSHLEVTATQMLENAVAKEEQEAAQRGEESHGGNPVADTSTLESVADLMDRQTRGRK